MALDPVTAVIDLANGVGSKLIDRLFPDKIAQATERAQAELALVQVQNDQDVKLLTASLSAIITEAQSNDPWTSRARPSFLYVMYIIILTAIPMGLLASFRPDTAAQVAQGFKAWLAAIPDSMWVLFGTGYLGYVTAKSYDRKKELENK